MIAIAVVEVKSDLSIILWRFALVTSIQGLAHTQLLLTWLAQLALQVGGPVLRIPRINSRKLALVWAEQKSSHCLSCWFGCLTVKVQAACFLSCIWQMGQSGFQVFMWGININHGFWAKVLPALCKTFVTWDSNCYTAWSQGSSSETMLGCDIIQQVQKCTTTVKDHLACSSTMLTHWVAACTFPLTSKIVWR
jgi:hypothetical protein